MLALRKVAPWRGSHDHHSPAPGRYEPRVLEPFLVQAICGWQIIFHENSCSQGNRRVLGETRM